MKWSKAIFRQYIATLSCLLCSVMLAICFTWYTPLMVWLLDSSNDEINGLDYDQLAWLVAIIEIGELCGPIPSGYLADRYGRKPCILSTFPLVVLSWALVFFTRSVAWLYVARIIQGVALGIYLTAGPIYIAEISQASIRGELSGQFQTLWFLGTVYAYSTGPFLSYQNYIISSALPAFLFFACFYYMPESPYFLLMRERRKEAEESLSWLRGDVNTQQELMSIQEEVKRPSDKEKNGGCKELLKNEQCRKAFVIVTIITLVKFLSGSTPILQFATQTFSKSVDPNLAHFITISMGLILTITSLFAAFVSDSFGRKPLVIFSTTGLGICSTVIAAYYYIERETKIDTSSYSWLVYAFLAAFCTSYNLGLGPLHTTLQAECFPSHIRAKAGAYMTILSNILCFISIKQYQVLDDFVGVYSNFIVFAMVCFIGLIFIICFMEETAKKTLGEIQNKQ